MKSPKDPRHQHRIQLMQDLFAWDFRSHDDENFEQIQPIIGELELIDDTIKACAPTWPLDKINKIDLSILRLAIFELNQADTPPKVVIDEAIELAKEYGSEASRSFINGVLGKVIEQQN